MCVVTIDRREVSQMISSEFVPSVRHAGVCLDAEKKRSESHPTVTLKTGTFCVGGPAKFLWIASKTPGLPPRRFFAGARWILLRDNLFKSPSTDLGSLLGGEEGMDSASSRMLRNRTCFCACRILVSDTKSVLWSAILVEEAWSSSCSSSFPLLLYIWIRSASSRLGKAATWVMGVKQTGQTVFPWLVQATKLVLSMVWRQGARRVTGNSINRWVNGSTDHWGWRELVRSTSALVLMSGGSLVAFVIFAREKCGLSV